MQALSESGTVFDTGNYGKLCLEIDEVVNNKKEINHREHG